MTTPARPLPPRPAAAPDLAAAYLALHEQLGQVAQGVQAALAEARESAGASQRQMDAHLVTQPGFAGSDGSRAAVHQRYIYLLSQVAALLPEQAVPPTD